MYNFSNFVRLQLDDNYDKITSNKTVNGKGTVKGECRNDIYRSRSVKCALYALCLY